MQAVILAAGQSSRFSPFNEVFAHKSLTPVMGKPILVHTIEAVVKAGIKEIILVVSKNSGIRNVLGDGRGYGVKIDYVVQEDPTGAGNGLLLCENLIKDDFFLVNVSRVDFDIFAKDMISKKNKNVAAVLLGKKQDDISKYGVLKVNGDRVLDQIEKPRNASKNDLRQIGIYLFSKDFLVSLRSVQDEHYSLEAAISKFTKEKDVRVVISNSFAPSLKYPWDLLEVKNYLFSKVKGRNIDKTAKVAKSAEIIGSIIIEENAEIMEGAKIKGPCFIGRNSIIGNNVIVRNGTSVEENCVIGANMEIKNTLIMKGSKTHSGFIGDSIVGENVRIGAQFATANVRLDRKSVKTVIKGEKIDTHLKSLGAFIGNNVKIGIKTSSMPGIIVGNNSVIGPSTVIQKNVDSDSRYYSKFQEIITEK